MHYFSFNIISSTILQRRKEMKKSMLIALVAIALLMSCSTTKTVEMNYLDYIEAHENEFFLTGKTDYTVEAKMVSSPTHVYNELELVSYDVNDDGVSVILKGTLGEEWVTNVSKVIKTYTKLDGSALDEEFFKNSKDVYQTIKTKPTKDSNFALFVPKNVILTVQTAWGDVLYTNKSEVNHGKGDYLMCSNKDGKPDLSDVWVVNGAQILKNYDMKNKH